MVVILPGDLTAIVPNPVEVEYKPGLELAPIHHQHMVEVIAVNWGQISLPENATTTAVQLMVAIVIGIVGVTVLFPVEEGGRLVVGVVITPPHSMVERIAQVLDLHFRRLHAIQSDALLMEAMVRGESGVIALKLAENKQAPEDETGCVTIPHRRMGAKIVQN